MKTDLQKRVRAFGGGLSRGDLGSDLTSSPDLDGQAKKILERGCDAFIQKPFTLKELSQDIRQLMRK